MTIFICACYSAEFPWAELGPGATVCDVGGGIGTIAMQLVKAHPNLQLKLQDLPECIAQAETQVWPKECPEAIKDQRIEFKAIDFLTESPIKGCDVYLVCCSPSTYRFAVDLLS